MTWSRILRLSRPRFWAYLFGPFLVGCAATGAFNHGFVMAPGQRVALFLAGFFFLFPANLFIYGINDLFDYETDKLNQKKQGYEALLVPAEHTRLLTLIALLLVPVIPLFFLLPITASGALLLFLLLGFGYSAPPVRAKARPFVDTVFNSLYVMPGLVGYSLFTQTLPSPYLITAGIAWCMAMHAFSAIPDQEADAAAGIETVATALGTYGTLVWCLVCYAVTAFSAYQVMGRMGVILLVPYLILLILSVQAGTSEKIAEVYKLFPRVNLLVGFALFVLAFYAR